MVKVYKIVLMLVTCLLMLSMHTNVVARDEYAPLPVGGEVISPNQFEYLVPWIAILAGISLVVGIVNLRERNSSNLD